MEMQESNARKSAARAALLFPNEQWTEVSPGIYLVASRRPVSSNQFEVLEKELSHARLLTVRGSVIYLLPEIGPQGEKHPDAIVDGFIMEFKTITGKVRQVEEHLRSARKKAENVFLKIDSPLTLEDVYRKIIGTVRSAHYRNGLIIVHFTQTGKTFYWNIDALGSKKPDSENRAWLAGSVPDEACLRPNIPRSS